MFLALVSMALSSAANAAECPTFESVKTQFSFLENTHSPIQCLDEYSIDETKKAYLLYQEVSTDSDHSSLRVKRFEVLHYAELSAEYTFVNPFIFKSLISNQSCGGYFKGARILGDTRLVALLFAHDVVRIGDTDSEDIYQTFDKRKKDVAYSCEGYTPNYDAGRELSVDTEKSQITFEYYNWEKAQEVCEDRPLEKEEQEFLVDMYSKNISRIEQAKIEDPENIKDYDEQITRYRIGLEYAKKGLDHNCGEQAPKESMTLNY